MSAKYRTKAGMDAEAVARMMAAQSVEEQAEGQVDATREEVVQTDQVDSPSASTEGAEGVPAFDPGKVDGRTLRRTGREPFATRIKPETHEALRRIAYTRRITIAEVVELAVAAYDGR